MLRIKDIRKQYRTGSLIQKALDGVSLNLRDNEFVAILGPERLGQDDASEYHRRTGLL